MGHTAVPPPSSLTQETLNINSDGSARPPPTWTLFRIIISRYDKSTYRIEAIPNTILLRQMFRFRKQYKENITIRISRLVMTVTEQ